MRVSPLKVAISLALWLALMCCLTVFYWWRWLNTDDVLMPQQRYFEVAKGESLQRVAARLHENEVVRWPNVWRFYARFFNPTSIKVGEYQFPEKASPRALLKALQEGKVITYPVTLVEGRSFREIVSDLATHHKLNTFLQGKPQNEQLILLNLDIAHPEGWFFPDTYQYIKGDSDVAILRRAHTKMQALLLSEWPQRDPDLPYDTPYEALIMASIIEKETGVESERRAIAGVFVRRLQQGMRLQTDPTVIYGLGETFDGNLTRAHLRTANPYNTYATKGLPPTPIAMPGAEAIRAALHPLPGDALYFVAKGDGSHHFSATLEEHNRAVFRYQKSQRKKSYRSAPPTVVPE